MINNDNILSNKRRINIKYFSKIRENKLFSRFIATVLPKKCRVSYFLVLFNPATTVVEFVVQQYDNKGMDYNRRL